MKTSKVARCEGQAVGRGDAADLKICPFRGNLVQAESLCSRSFEKPRGGVSGRRIEGVDSRSKSPDDACDRCFKGFASFASR